MPTALKKIRLGILSAIDFFYPPFKHWISIDIFRYAVCGGVNTVFDWVLYFLIFHYVVKAQVLDLGFIAFTPHIASLFITFPITFTTGFLLSKYISFQGSTLKGGVQLIRYALVVAACIVINYVCLKLFVEVCHFYPTPSKMLTTIITVVFSFFSQRHFTFRKQ